MAAEDCKTHTMLNNTMLNTTLRIAAHAARYYSRKFAHCTFLASSNTVGETKGKQKGINVCMWVASLAYVSLSAALRTCVATCVLLHFMNHPTDAECVHGTVCMPTC